MFPVALVVLASLLQTSPEIEVTARVANASPNTELLHGVAGGDDSALLVWSDETGLRAVRIDRDGDRIDAAPLVLGRGRETAAVARAADRWLVVWKEDAMVARFAGDDGSVSLPFAIAPERGLAYDVAVAANRTGFLVTRSSDRGSHALRLDAEGRRLRKLVLPENVASFEPVAFEDGFAIVWATQEKTIEVLRIDGAGDRRETLATLDREPLVVLATADGDELVVAWSVWNGNGADLSMMREGEAPRVVAHDRSSPWNLFVSGGQVWAVLTSSDEVQLVAEDGSQRVVGQTRGADRASATAFAERVLIASNTGAYDTREIRFNVVDATLSDTIVARRLATDVPSQTRPAIARGANGESLAVWIESGTDTPGAVMGAILGSNGRAIIPPIFIAPLSIASSEVEVASDGTDYLVLFSDRLTVQTRRVLRDGTPAGEPRVIPNATPQDTCVAWTGNEYIAGWLHVTFSGKGIQYGTVNATTIARDGTHQGHEVVSSLRGHGHLACAAGETATLFVWTEVGWELTGVLRTHGGAMSGRIPLSHDGQFPTVAANGRSFAVAWPESTIRRAIVSEHGTVAFPVEPPLDGLQFDPMLRANPIALAPFGSGYLLVWGIHDLRALALDADGRAAGTTTIAASTDIEVNAAIAGGRVPVVIYTRGDRVGWYASNLRAYARTITALPQPARRRSTRH